MPALALTLAFAFAIALVGGLSCLRRGGCVRSGGSFSVDVPLFCVCLVFAVG